MGVRSSRAVAIAGGYIAVVASAGEALADATVDWARGLVIAEGIGVADRHAPSPAAARGPSRRVAEDRAREQIAGTLGELPLAEGGMVATKADDPNVKAGLARAVSSAVTLSAEPETDGSWRVTMGVPIEAVRTAIYGRRTLPADGDRGPPVVVVTGVKAKPAIGWTVEGTRVSTLWVTAIPPWAADAPKIRAAKASRGAIDVQPQSPRGAADTKAAATPLSESTLVVMVRKP